MNDSDAPAVAHDQQRHPVHAWREALLADGGKWPAHDLNPTARLVGLGLSMHAHWSMKSWPSAATVAARCGLADRAVRRGFDALEDAGWIVAERRGGVPGGGRTTTWILTTPVAETEVTPVPKTEVKPTTSVSRDTTPVSEAPTPVAKTDELEELVDELEGVAPERIAFTLVGREPGEATPVIQAAIAKHGTRRVTELVRSYAVTGMRFTFASDLRKRIDMDAPHAPRSLPSFCGDCSSGWVSPPGSMDATRCACNPDPVAAVTA